MPRPPSGPSERTRGYVTLSRDSDQLGGVDQSLTSPVRAHHTQRASRWRVCPSVEETEMEAEVIRRAWAAKREGSQASANVDEHIDRADLLGAFQACDVDGNGQIGAVELHAILQAIGAEVSLAGVAAIIAEAERMTGQDEIHAAAAAAAAAAAPPPPPRPAANASHDFSRPFGALAMVTDAAAQVGAQVTGIAETVATAVVEAAEEAAEYTGLIPVAARGVDRHDGQLDFVEFQMLMEGPLLEPLFAGLTSPRDPSPAEKDENQNDPGVEADVALLYEHGLEEHMERLRHGNWLGTLGQATPDDLQSIGLPVLHARTLAHTAGLTPMARARKRVGKIRALRRAFDTADVDCNDRLEKQELETVLVSLHPCAPSPDDVEYLWRILCGLGWAQKSFLSWCDFLHGLARVRVDKRAMQLMDLNRPNEWALISLLIDVKFSDAQADALMKDLSFFELVGMRTLQTMQREQLVAHQVQQVLSDAATGRVRYTRQLHAGAVLRHKRRVGCIAFFIAFVTNLIPGLWENYTAWDLNTNGISDLYYTCNEVSPLEVVDDLQLEPCPISSVGTILQYWARDLPMIIGCIICEIVLLGITAVRTACAIASEFGYRLYPLNQERYFVATALIRACFELGNPKSAVLGTDPSTQSTFRRRAALFLLGTLCALKIVLLGVIVKQVMGATMPVQWAVWAVSYAALISSCFWDTLVCRVIMEQVELILAGIATGTEVFNEIFATFSSAQTTHSLSNSAKIVCVRAIAVAIRTHGTVLPTTELLLRHSIQYFGLTGTHAVETPSTPLDSVPCFLSDLRTLRRDEQTLVLTVLLLAQLLDGEIEEGELVLWSRIYRHIGRMQPPDEDALRGCACAFRKGILIDVQLLQAALDEDQSNDRPAELGLSDSLWVKTQKVLLK